MTSNILDVEVHMYMCQVMYYSELTTEYGNKGKTMFFQEDLVTNVLFCHSNTAHDTLTIYVTDLILIIGITYCHADVANYGDHFKDTLLLISQIPN